ncbi:thiamine pyrophosphate-dependent dehydrogenase E1 component subunit alpha [Candidatus Saganbacteria bacterium]|nr:thiamine pyrophosphate-dependent dehydrogenase E1 component subunit alpha [Candidatus Saganbacteria bacterium]
MLKVRIFEEKIDWLFSRGLLGGTSHMCIGQEAVAAGISANLNLDDYVISSHRGHGHLIAKGGEVRKIFSELMGKVDGYCQGKGGTQHLCAKEIGFYGTNGIVGGGIPVATGIALSIKLRRSRQVAVVFFGDGATNQGTFHESLNMASIWGLPILFVCENNLYGMSAPVSKMTNIKDLARRADAYNIKSHIVDGMDVEAVFARSGEALNYIRDSQKPCFIEAKTYRHCGHSKSDARVYRTKEEEKCWREKDCLDVLKTRLISLGFAAEQMDKIKAETEQEIEAAWKLSEKSEDTPLSLGLKGVYKDG